MPVTRDSLILRIARENDPVSWEEFVSVYRPFLHNVVRRWGLPEHDACDIVQDVFVTLLRALPQFEYRMERGRFRGWLRTIVQNTAIDRLRRRGRMREVALSAEICDNDLVANDDDWDVAYRAQIARSAMRQVRSRSIPATWMCFEEHVLKARAAADIAAESGLSAAAVYVNASRTLARIRAKCAEYDADLDTDGLRPGESNAGPGNGRTTRRSAEGHSSIGGARDHLG